MAGLSVQQTARQFIASAERLRDSLKTRALVQALNRAAGGVKTDASAEIRKTYKIKKKAVDRAFKLRRASAASLTAVISIRGYPLSLGHFNPKLHKRGHGVSVDVKGRRKVIRGAWMRTIRTSFDDEFQLIYVREGSGRYPIKVLKTVDVPSLFVMRDLNDAVKRGVRDRFEKEFARLLRHYAATGG